jgi:hypothetical protein
MDFEISFRKETGYFLIKTSGDTTPDDVEASLLKVFTSPDWSNGKNILYDNRLENLEKLTSDDVQRISLKFTQFNDKLKNSKIAMVMPKDVAYGLARMWENYTETDATFKTNVFRSIDNALKWIEEKE